MPLRANFADDRFCQGAREREFCFTIRQDNQWRILTTIFDATPDLVYGFRCVQHKDLSITIEYIPAKDESRILSVLNAFAKKIGDEVPVDFKKVDSIAHDRGKLRFVVRER